MNTAHHFDTVTIVGAGIMGAGIAQVVAAATGAAVHLCDLEQARLDGALDRIENGRFGLRRSIERGKLSAQDVGTIMARIETHTDLAAACTATDLVIEAVPEDLALKCRLFRQLDALCPDHAVLSSNTAGLPITAMAWATGRPEKVIGWHWAQPTAVIKLAEIVIHADTDPVVAERVCSFAAACGKHPEQINDNPFAWGFVANRIFEATYREARRVVAEGVATAEQVDRILKDSYRWPVGPMEMRNQKSFE